MASLTMTAEEVRKELGAYLTKPITITSGTLSTQQELSATSLSTGGLSGAFIIRGEGYIGLLGDNNILSIFIGFE